MNYYYAPSRALAPIVPDCGHRSSGGMRLFVFAVRGLHLPLKRNAFSITPFPKRHNVPHPPFHRDRCCILVCCEPWLVSLILRVTVRLLSHDCITRWRRTRLHCPDAGRRSSSGTGAQGRIAWTLVGNSLRNIAYSHVPLSSFCASRVDKPKTLIR